MRRGSYAIHLLSGYEVDLMEVLDPHTVAGLLKLHFREMKASLIPRGLPLTYLMMHVKNQDVREPVRDQYCLGGACLCRVRF